MKTYTKAGKPVLFFNFALKGRSLHGKASFQIRAISHGRDHSSPRKIQSQVCVDTISVFEEGLQLSPDVYKNLNSRTNFGSQIRRYTTSVPSRKSREKRSTPRWYKFAAPRNKEDRTDTLKANNYFCDKRMWVANENSSASIAHQIQELTRQTD